MEFKRALKSLDNKTGERIVSGINAILTAHERYSGSYFWTPQGNAAARRREEFTNELVFNLDGTAYTIMQGLSISCKNFYYTCVVCRDGQKSNISVIKRLVTDA